MISGYLTGYPLTESGYYAFARTWPAPEMPRPGCVWTHTILIEFSDIPSLQSAIGLLGLFRRPRGKDLGYGEALTLSEVSSDASPPDPAAARRILWAIARVRLGHVGPAMASAETRLPLLHAVLRRPFRRRQCL
jgi:hypothetical protein